MNQGGKWLAQSTIYRNGIDLVLVLDPWGDGMAVAQPVDFVMKTQNRHDLIAEPTLSLSPDSAQTLLQALWDAGLRPNNGAGSGAEVTALKAHIQFAERMADGLLKGNGHNG